MPEFSDALLVPDLNRKIETLNDATVALELAPKFKPNEAVARFYRVEGERSLPSTPDACTRRLRVIRIYEAYHL